MSKSPHGLPSLTSIQAFEAAARRLSFKDAAGELNVTPAAVSRQIRAIEEWFGRALFERRHRRVTLTAEGRAFYAAVSNSFGAMSAAARALRAPTGRYVTVGSTSSVAEYWLVPRLNEFWREYPDVRLDHVISDLPIDLATSRVDLAIRFGQGAWPGLTARMLFADTIYPVASPDYLARFDAVAAPEDLHDLTLIDIGGVSDEGWLGWSEWLRAMGASPAVPRLRQINSYSVALRAALDGQGVILGWDSLVRRLVANGRLVRLLPQEYPAPGAFFLVRRADRDPPDEARLLEGWLLDCVRMESLEPEG